MYVFLIKIKLNNTILKFVILLIAVHPVFTSSVVWIPARNDTLLAVFMYTSFIFFIDYLETKSTKDMLLYILFLMLSLLTKESAILTLFLYVSFVWCFGYKLTKKEILTNVLIFIPMISIYIYLRSIAVSGDNISYYLTQTAVIAKNTLVGSIIYLYQFVIPDVHVMLYNVALHFFHFIVVILILFLCCFGLYKNFISKKVFLWCVSVFILLVFPTSFLTDEYIILNHRLVAVIPAIIIVVVCFIDKIMMSKNTRISLFVFFIALFSLYVSKSFSFENNYREKNIYWINSYKDAPDCHATAYWIGRLYFENGELTKAKEFFIRANKLKSIYLSDLALIYYYEGNYNEAEELYNKSLESGINKAQCYRNLSVIYLKRDNDTNKAIEYAKLAVREEPYDDGYKQYLWNLQKLTDEKVNI